MKLNKVILGSLIALSMIACGQTGTNDNDQQTKEEQMIEAAKKVSIADQDTDTEDTSEDSEQTQYSFSKGGMKFNAAEYEASEENND